MLFRSGNGQGSTSPLAGPLKSLDILPARDDRDDAGPEGFQSSPADEGLDRVVAAAQLPEQAGASPLSTTKTFTAEDAVEPEALPREADLQAGHADMVAGQVDAWACHTCTYVNVKTASHCNSRRQTRLAVTRTHPSTALIAPACCCCCCSVQLPARLLPPSICCKYPLCADGRDGRLARRVPVAAPAARPPH